VKRRTLMALPALATLAPIALVAALANGAGAAAPAVSPAVSNAVSIIHPPLVVAPSQGLRNDSLESTNWSGYAVSASSEFTEAVGSWVEPAAKCSGRNSTTYASFWVGIDGYTSDSVEQLGTDSDCSRGNPSYYVWYEMYPANSVELSKSTYPVNVGDTLTATVDRSGTSYTLSLTDTSSNTTSPNWTFSKVLTGSNANSSAEWVAESPEICSFFCQLASLTDFGTVTFSGAQAADGGTLSPVSSFTASSGPHEITMVTNNGTVRAEPGALTSSGQGSGFSDTWEHS